MKAAT